MKFSCLISRILNHLTATFHTLNRMFVWRSRKLLSYLLLLFLLRIVDTYDLNSSHNEFLFDQICFQVKYANFPRVLWKMLLNGLMFDSFNNDVFVSFTARFELQPWALICCSHFVRFTYRYDKSLWTANACAFKRFSFLKCKTNQISNTQFITTIFRLLTKEVFNE